MRYLSTTSRFEKLDLTPTNFSPSARDFLVIEKSKAGLEFKNVRLFGGKDVRTLFY